LITEPFQETNCYAFSRGRAMLTQFGELRV
jgi:hypothetical protein